ncbi:PQQ-dependent dehydrogenase, methanol/ethanol family [Glaciimonas immobilis]|nr:PQQ-dependent dehydrogenase, methanol/ethanol family [Glaciimonas immobilis]KAF3996717.1 PQQ-dependent dehydrogenase, methanol/ethanol family [Glaciimonas immobilis]
MKCRKTVRSLGLLAVLCAIGTLPLNAQTLENLSADSAHPENVLTYGMGYEQQRFSTLKQINKKNVKKLVPVWALSMENDSGEQAQPLVMDGVMYVSDAKWTVAIDALSGKQIWRTAVDFDPDTPRVVCCGVSNKGVALYNGMVFRGTLDANMVALDQKTGKEIWKTKVSDWKDGYSITGAPLVANGVLMTGVSGADFGVRGFVDGYDPATGKQLWRRYTTAAPDEKGGDTWTVENAYKTGGASTWLTGSYDPVLDLVYWGTGNAAPWNPNSRRGDSLYAASVIAMRPKTGEIVWHYQFTPNDMFDFDATSEMILGDLKIGGKPRNVLMQLDRNGFAYVLDRANGKLLAANPYGKVNWASHIDMETGRPVETGIAKSLRNGESAEIWPSIIGTKNWAHAAFNPHTGLLYANTLHMSSSYKLDTVAPYKPGMRWLGVKDVKIAFEPDAPHGFMAAIDPMTGIAKWKVPLNDSANWSSMLATAGSLIFTGRHSGEFIALDADTGKTIWQFQTSSGINASPITWSMNGKQYVTVMSGFGGLGKRWVGPSAKNIPQGGSVWTFALAND